jgi:beta-glucosidase
MNKRKLPFSFIKSIDDSPAFKELKGFAKVSLEPGEKKAISIKLNRDAFAFYDPDRRQWVVEPGEFEIMVGSSSKDIRLNDALMVKIPTD